MNVILNKIVLLTFWYSPNIIIISFNLLLKNKITFPVISFLQYLICSFWMTININLWQFSSSMKLYALPSKYLCVSGKKNHISKSWLRSCRKSKFFWTLMTDDKALFYFSLMLFLSYSTSVFLFQRKTEQIWNCQKDEDFNAFIFLLECICRDLN